MRKSLHTRQHRLLIEALKEARKSAGLRQAQIAKRLGVHQSFVAKYEKGERRIDVVEFLTIATALDADPVSIMRRLIAVAK